MALKLKNFNSQVKYLDRCFDDEKASFLRQMFFKEDEFCVVASLFPDARSLARTREGGGIHKAMTLERARTGEATRDPRLDWGDIEKIWADVEACRGAWGNEDGGGRRRFIARLMVVVGWGLSFCEKRPGGVLGKLCEWEV